MVKLERDDKLALEFEGWVLGQVSTHIPGKERWTELTIWAVEPTTSDVLWVVETVGRSIVDGETDRRNAYPCRTVTELVACLSRDGQLTAPGRSVLQMAQREDDELVYVLEQGVERL